LRLSSVHIVNAGISNEAGQQEGSDMKYGLLKLTAAAAMLVVGLATAQAQTAAGPNRPAPVPAGYVITPFGYYHPSCVVQLAQGDELRPDQGVVRHADGATGNMQQCAYPHYRADGAAVYGDERGVKDPDISHAWIVAEYATTGAISGTPTSSYGFLTTEWTVPPAPKSNDGQTLYYFNGLEEYQNVVTIVQPVLGWNGNGLSGWSIASWNCCYKGTTYHATAQPVSSGDTILGYMWDTCAAGTLSCSKWDIVTWDLQNGKFSELDNTSSQKQTFNWAFGGVLEVYNVKQCSDYPNNANGLSGGTHNISFDAIGLYNYKMQKIASPAWTFWNAVGTTATPQCSYGGSAPSQVILTY
jgi:hypothetical protein